MKSVFVVLAIATAFTSAVVTDTVNLANVVVRPVRSVRSVNAMGKDSVGNPDTLTNNWYALQAADEGVVRQWCCCCC